ncbi:ubiquinol oxidase subunit II [Halomonas sp. 18H]|uniref:ubiquinol oxidase subunit II n=1 Tax=Halomonas almeriensis TaxID=308163 RepID=UPI00222E38CA|nr:MULTISPECIES: ubiquinol oxidase subunit II [Halomonas]MCW4149240.1 ubiquinol oxidase subunit II [Halomonas sp. 18H]MDN3552208.1 ubiquinol oxidase subunit II [Halomonas almeriensis]
MRRNPTLRMLGVLLLLSLPVLLAGCSSALMDPKGQIGEEQRTLILTAFGLMQIVVIPVIVMTLLFAWRYRRSNKDATYSPDWSHSNKIEAVVWFIPCVIILFLAVLTWYTSHSLDPHKAIAPDEDQHEPMEIQAISLDWKWLFVYPEQGIATVNEVAFPVDTPVRFRVTSGSVMNSFFIPRLGSQIYAMAGMDNDVHLVADDTGTYPGRSTNYSGAGFSGMTFDAHVGTQDEFEAWVEDVKTSPDSLGYPEEYYELVTPSVHDDVQYFSNVAPSLYEQVVKSFHAGGNHAEYMETYVDASVRETLGHGGGHGDGHGSDHGEGHGDDSESHNDSESHGESMSAEAAE